MPIYSTASQYIEPFCQISEMVHTALRCHIEPQIAIATKLRFGASSGEVRQGLTNVGRKSEHEKVSRYLLFLPLPLLSPLFILGAYVLTI